jgi:hypothetical protein
MRPKGQIKNPTLSIVYFTSSMKSSEKFEIDHFKLGLFGSIELTIFLASSTEEASISRKVSLVTS